MSPKEVHILRRLEVHLCDKNWVMFYLNLKHTLRCAQHLGQVLGLAWWGLIVSVLTLVPSHMSAQTFQNMVSDPNSVLSYHFSPSRGSDSPHLFHATYMLEAGRRPHLLNFYPDPSSFNPDWYQYWNITLCQYSSNMNIICNWYFSNWSRVEIQECWIPVAL